MTHRISPMELFPQSRRLDSDAAQVRGIGILVRGISPCP
jgi:hypothetical protein